jgi:hypothetical protein
MKGDQEFSKWVGRAFTVIVLAMLFATIGALWWRFIMAPLLHVG